MTKYRLKWAHTTCQGGELPIDINKKKIILKDHIKLLGSYTASVKIHEGIIAKLKINVIGM